MTDQMAVGPTLRFKAGHTVRVPLQNNLNANPAGLYKLNTVYPQLEIAWFQPLNL
jgi:FtsP/CotA-like multicopper oxidase with cupredoxin domain